MGLCPNQSMIVLQICRSHGAFKEYFISIAQVEIFRAYSPCPCFRPGRKNFAYHFRSWKVKLLLALYEGCQIVTIFCQSSCSLFHQNSACISIASVCNSRPSVSP